MFTIIPGRLDCFVASLLAMTEHVNLHLRVVADLFSHLNLIWVVQMFGKKEIACAVGQIRWRLPPVPPR